MYHLDVCENGRLKGWISSEIDGRPQEVTLLYKDISVNCFASEERVDLPRAGHNLFAGFDFNLSTSKSDDNCILKILEDEYEVNMQIKDINELLTIDESGGSSFRGWIAVGGRPAFMTFGFDGEEHFVDLTSRPDVSHARNLPESTLLGFESNVTDFEELDWINIDNRYIHFLKP